jgi:hypothetical protein
MAEFRQAPRSQWPDKSLFAASLVLAAGLFGAAFVGVVQVAHIDDRIPSALRQMPAPLTLTLSLVAAGLAVLAMRTKKHAFAWLGAACAVGSLGIFGLTSVAGLAACILLLLALVEGEDHQPRLAANVWPDKALAASLALAVGGLFAIWQGIAVMAGRMDPMFASNAPVVMGGLDIALGLFSLAGAMDAYKVRRPRIVMLGALATVASLSAYVLGPILGVTALVLVFLAHREDEWT